MTTRFSLPRIFALVGGMVFMLAAFALGYFGHQVSSGQLVKLTETNNAAIATALANLLDTQLHTLLSNAEAQELRDYDHLTGVDQIVRRVSRGTPVLKVRILNRHARIGYSSESDDIGKQVPPDSHFLAALAGGVTSSYAKWREFDSLDGRLAEVDVVSSHVPVVDADGFRREGVFEIHMDVTALADQIARDSIVRAAVIAAGFAAIYVLLLCTVAAGSRIVARKQAETLALAAAAARAEAASQAKSEFLVNMSHELRTPLNAIIGFSDVIRNEVYGAATPAIYRDYAGHIHGAGTHLLGIINDILDLLKTNAGKMQVTLADADANAVLARTAELMQSPAAKAQVRLDCIGDPSLPVVQADERKLLQVLINLADNAIKFTPVGGLVTLAARENKQGDAVEISVTDSGIGIAQDDIAVCLEAFGQVDGSLARRHQGTGLGLPLSKKFIELMGGTLSIESSPGRGTKVTVTLPLKVADRTEQLLAA